MENENKDVATPEVDETTEETEVEEIDVPTEEEAEEQESEESSDDSELREQLERLEKENKTLKIQKAKLKEKKAEPVKKEVKNSNEASDQLSKDEAILYAKGRSEEEVEKVMKIADIEGISPLAANDSEYFKLWKERQDAKKEAQDTQLGASKGSVKTKPKKDVSSPGLSSEDHEALFKQKMGM